MENISLWEVYLYGVYENINIAVQIIFFILVIVITVGFFDTVGDVGLMRTDNLKHRINIGKKIAIATIISLLLCILLPPKNIFLAMIALNPTKQILHNIADSNRTKAALNSLDNFIVYINKKMKEDNNANNKQ